MTDYERIQERPMASSWAYEALYFAGVMLILVGGFQVVMGFAAIFDDEFFVLTENYVFDLDTTAWGWIHVIIGLALIAAGVSLFRQSVWGGAVALFIAVLSAISNFFFIPYYPFWSILIIGLDVWIIWAVTRRGVFR